MKASFVLEIWKVKGYIILLMEMYIMASGKKIKAMAKENIFLKMGILISVIFQMDKKMVREYILTLMVRNMKETLKVGKELDLALFSLKMGINMKGSFGTE